MSPMIRKTLWKTEDEIHFINGLGNYSMEPKDRVKLLASYQVSLNDRRDWGVMNRDAVMSHIAMLIQEEGARV